MHAGGQTVFMNIDLLASMLPATATVSAVPDSGSVWVEKLMRPAQHNDKGVMHAAHVRSSDLAMSRG